MEQIRVSGLHKTYDYYTKEAGLRHSLKNLFSRKTLIKEAVKSISFEIERGECVGFIGPNGAGKTTTLKMLSGILYPTDGEASVFGFTPWERKNEFSYEIADDDYNRMLAELTEMLDVRHLLHVQVRRLSLGERMKMELIAALIHKPKLLFLDEPTIGLDLISQKKVRDFLTFYNEQFNATLLLTSHYMRDIEDVCKRTIIINEGNLIYDGDIKKIDAKFSQSKVLSVQFSEHVDAERLQVLGDVQKTEQMHTVIVLPKERLKHVSRTLLDQFPVVDFTVTDVPLEESIAKLYGKEVAAG